MHYSFMESAIDLEIAQWNLIYESKLVHKYQKTRMVASS